MKKLLFGVVLIFALSACEKTDSDDSNSQNTNPKTEIDSFTVVLTSRQWNITSYEFQDHLNNMFPLRNFVTDSIYTRSSERNPDPCGWSGTKTSPMGLWASYVATFTSSTMNGSFSHSLRTVDWDETKEDECKLVYKTVTTTTASNSKWTYDKTKKTITVSFGEPYKVLDGQTEFFEMEYNIVSFSNSKIVLKGLKNYNGQLFLTNNIILE